MEEFTAVLSTPTDQPQTRLVTFSGAMTIRSGSQIKAALVEAFNAAESIVVDLEGVTEIDLIGLQFVCSFHRSAIVYGKAFSVRGTGGEVIQEAMAAAGFSRVTGCSQNPESPCVWVCDAEPASRYAKVCA